MQIELLPEDEYALWEQVLVSAEQNSTSATADPAPSLPLPAQELSVPNQAVDVSAAGAGAAVPDLEDFGLKVNRLVKYRPRGLYVTDIAESEWCQQQKAFALSVRLPKEETEAMVAGTVVHAALEAELVKVVQVETVSSEDRWSVRLLNVLTHLHQLLRKGKTREMFVWGHFKGQWIRGIIDAMELDERGHIKVVEHKTRRVPSLPRAAQQQNAKLQVMTYRLLLEQLSDTCSLAKRTTFFHLLKLNSMRPLSESVQQYIENLRLAWPLAAAGQEVTLSSIAELLHQQVLVMPQCSDQVSVRYIWQTDRQVIGELNSEYDQKWVMFRLRQHVDFLEGTWSPQPVPEDDKWKCYHCRFCLECPVGRDSLKQ